jgi:WXXGXW repeat (2 copies)
VTFKYFALSMGSLITAATLLAGLLTPSPQQQLPPPSPKQSQPPPPSPAQQGQNDEAVPQGMEILARGPIHEAFAEPADPRPGPGEVVPKQPPQPIEELPPEQKPSGEDVEWIPGYWAWEDARGDFLWVSGVWRVPPPGEQWVPGHWSQVAGGWQWVPGFWTDVQSSEVQYLPQPPEPLEAAPSSPQPDPNSAYVPGNWVYTDDHYAWRTGYWVNYQPGWVWIPAHYVWSPNGYIFIEGHWDFDLQDRGLLFAPILFKRPLWHVASWAFTPQYVVSVDYLLGCLFVGPHAHSYYFGNFFDADAVRLGYRPWIDYRIGRYGYDPLFAYYRWAHRTDPQWTGDLRALYAGRLHGTVARPPIDLRQQLELARRAPARQRNYVAGLTPLATAAREKHRLISVPPAERTQHQNLAHHFRSVSNQRQDLEAARRPEQTTVRHLEAGPKNAQPNLHRTEVAPQHETTRRPQEAPVRHTEAAPQHEAPRRPQEAPARHTEAAPQHAKLNLQRPQGIPKQAPAHVQPPPHPQMPKVEQRQPTKAEHQAARPQPKPEERKH